MPAGIRRTSGSRVAGVALLHSSPLQNRPRAQRGRRGQRLLDSFSVGLDLDPVVLAVGLRSALRLLPLCGPAPLLLGLCLVVVEAVTEEYAQVVVGMGVYASVVQFLIDCLDDASSRRPGHDAFALANQVADLLRSSRRSRSRQETARGGGTMTSDKRAVRRREEPFRTARRAGSTTNCVMAKRPDRVPNRSRLAHGSSSTCSPATGAAIAPQRAVCRAQTRSLAERLANCLC